MAKRLSIIISKIIGTDSRKIANPIEPLVKSRSEPLTASLITCQGELSNASTGAFLNIVRHNKKSVY